MKREYPDAPIVGVGAIIVQEGQLVLIQRGHEPAKGKWTFPGGVVELGETIQEAIRREALEETGLIVELGDVATVVDRVERDTAGRVQYHYVIIDFYAHPTGGTLRPGEDAADARWVRLDDLDTLDMTEPAGDIARKVLREAAKRNA